MASTPTRLVSVGDYLARTEKPNAEYVDGVVCPKPMRSFSHALVQKRTLTSLDRLGAIALPELTVHVSTTPVKFLVPDVAVVRRIEGDYPTEPALLCVEILSPEQRLGEMLAKCEQYHAWGVPYCWVIDPEKRTGWEYHKDGEPVKRTISGVLQAGELKVPLADLLSGIEPTRS